MKIGVFFTWDYSLETWLNSKTIERELKFFNSLEQKKHTSFSFFTYGSGIDKGIGESHKLNKVIPIYSKLYYFKKRILRILVSFFIPLLFKKEIKKLDLLFQNQLLGSWVPILIKYFFKKPLIIRTGYNMLDFAIKDNKSKLIIFFYKLLTRISLKTADLITVTSITDLDYFKTNYPKYEKKIEYRPNWVEVEHYNPFENRFKNRIITVGRLENQKNYKFLINEFKNTKEFLQIDVVGNGSEKSKLIELSKNLNVKLNFLGNIENDLLIKKYQEYQFYISTSLFEGNPKSVLEAMGSGCVVFLSNIPNHSELVKKNISGVVFELQDKELRSKYDDFKNNITFLKKISNNAVNEIAKTNSLENSTKLFFNDFKNLII